MLPACNRGAGANVHIFDVCLTPPVPPRPVPYVNKAFNITGFLFVPNVFITNLPAHNIGTWLMTSTGDEAGVLHWTIKGWSRYITGNPIVFIGMLPGEHLTCRSIGNRGNAPKGACAIPSAVNVFYTSTEAQEARTRGDAAMANLLPFTGAEGLLRTRTDEAAGEVTFAIEKIAPSIPTLLRTALRDAKGSVQLDLRGNPGGDLEAAIRIVELFVPRGSLAALVEDGYGDRFEKRTRAEPVFDGPLTLIVDRNTGSAAEVVAAALQRLGRARVVGERTFGKGTVQVYDKGEMTTVLHVLDPSGAELDGVGVTP